MTGNQIAYWSLQEQRRSNLVNEGIKRQDTESNISRRHIQNQVDLMNADTNAWNAAANVVKATTGSLNPLASLFN